jgi:hypothetical protein
MFREMRGVNKEEVETLTQQERETKRSCSVNRGRGWNRNANNIIK